MAQPHCLCHRVALYFLPLFLCNFFSGLDVTLSLSTRISMQQHLLHQLRRVLEEQKITSTSLPARERRRRDSEMPASLLNKALGKFRLSLSANDMNTNTTLNSTERNPYLGLAFDEPRECDQEGFCLNESSIHRQRIPCEDTRYFETCLGWCKRNVTKCHDVWGDTIKAYRERKRPFLPHDFNDHWYEALAAANVHWASIP